MDIYKNFLNILKKNFIYILIFLLAFSIRLYCIYNKTFSYHDEAYSFIASTQANLSPEGEYKFLENVYRYNYKTGKNYLFSEIKNTLIKSNANWASVKNDLSILRTKNIDNPHSNLYYSIIRLWNNGYDVSDFMTLVRHLTYLNLIFFCMSFFFMYKLLSLIKDDKKFIALGLFFAFICTGGISNTVFAREYALSETFFIISTYVTLLLSLKIISDSQINYKEITLFSFAYSIYILSHYFAVLYFSMILLILLIFCIKYKRKIHTLKIFIISILTYFFTTLCYPNYFNFNSDNEHYGNICGNILNIKNSFILLIENYKNDNIDIINLLFYKSVLIALLVIFFIIFAVKIIKKKSFLTDNKFSKKEKYISVLLITIGILWSIIVLTIVPYKLIRYIFPVFPILSMVFAVLCYRLNKVFLSFIVILYFLCSFLPVIYKQEIPFMGKIIYMTQNDSKINDYKMFPDDEVKLIEELKNKNILKNADNIVYNYKLSSDYPLVVINQYWYYPAFYLQRMDDNAIIRFEDEIPFNKDNFDYNKFFILVSDENQQKIYEYYTNIIRIFEQSGTSLFFVDENN